MHRVGRRHDIEMCQCLMKAGQPSVSFSYPAGRHTSSLRSLVDRKGQVLRQRARSVAVASQVLWGMPHDFNVALSTSLYRFRCPPSVR